MKCVKCGKTATTRFSPDLDIVGIGSCDECLESVQMAYVALLQGATATGENLGEQMVNNWQKKLATKKIAKDT